MDPRGEFVWTASITPSCRLAAIGRQLEGLAGQLARRRRPDRPLWSPGMLNTLYGCARSAAKHLGSIPELARLQQGRHVVHGGLAHAGDEGPPGLWQWHGPEHFDLYQREQTLLVRIAALAVHKGAGRLRDAEKAEAARTTRRKLDNPSSGLHYAQSWLRQPVGTPLASLRDCNGRVTSDPLEVDRVARLAAAAIYDRGAGLPGPAALIADVAKRFGSRCHVAAEFSLPELTTERLLDCIQASACNAGGLDQWTFKVWRVLNFVAVDWLRKLLTMIEDHGAPWPSDVLHARAAFIHKPDTDEQNPLSFRVLSILPVLYRLWAKARLADLQAWIASWATEELFSAVEGYGAGDASYQSAVVVETWCVFLFS